MSRRSLRPGIDVCYLCESMLSRKALPVRSIRATQASKAIRLFSAQRPNLQQERKYSTASSVKNKSSIKPDADHKGISGIPQDGLPDLEQTFGQVKSNCNSILVNTERIPAENEVEQCLTQCAQVVNLLKVGVRTRPFVKKTESKGNSASALLELEDYYKVEPPRLTMSTLAGMQEELSKLVYSVITHPTVSITPNILALYVKIHHTLRKPASIAGIFHLYANKPLPKEGTSPITYSNQNPDKAANAIPQPIADKALEAAIEKKDLNAAMDLIEFSYATKAYRRAKFIKTGLLPVTGLAAAPFAAYVVASQFAHWQTTMETELATNVAFAGMVAYVGFTGTIGLVALTTANDQMDRVTWAPGIPLRDRWIREDERAAVDKIAGAWGFRELWRRGEEEGAEWDAIREWAGLKGMILDRTELMEGME
jgi:hypothetical protein